MNMDRKPKILFIRTDKNSSFMNTDLEILNKHFNTRVVDFTLDFKEIALSFKAFWRIAIGVLLSDVVFVWFAGLHSYIAVKLAKIFNKKTIIIVGGGDVVIAPEIDYGLLLNSRYEKYVYSTLENASLVLSFSRNSLEEIKKFPIKIADLRTLYLGIDINKFKPLGLKDNYVLTVGFISYSNLKRKGLEAFVRAANYMPDINFILIGKPLDESINYLKSFAPANVKFIEYVPLDELIKYYQRAKVYAQLSAHEGFGMALAEAMSCECIPVVTNKGAIPEVVGDTGFYALYNDYQSIATATKNALTFGDGKKARERICKTFTLEKREDEIVKTIMDLVGNN